MEKIKICSSVYEVSESELEEFGRCEIDNSRILIRKGLVPNQRGKTALHEVLHAIWYEFSIPEAEEEVIIRKLEAGLGAFMIDNPEFFDQVVKDIRHCWGPTSFKKRK